MLLKREKVYELRFTRVGLKMSAHAVVFEVWLHVETDCCVSSYQSREFAWHYHGLCSALWIFP